MKHFCALNFGFILKSCYVLCILEYENKLTLDDSNGIFSPLTQAEFHDKLDVYASILLIKV